SRFYPHAVTAKTQKPASGPVLHFTVRESEGIAPRKQPQSSGRFPLDIAEQIMTRADVKKRQPTGQEVAERCWNPSQITKVHHVDAAAGNQGRPGGCQCALPIGDHGKTVGKEGMFEPILVKSRWGKLFGKAMNQGDAVFQTGSSDLGRG